MVTTLVGLSPELPLLIIGVVALSLVARLWRFFRRLPSELLGIAAELPRYTKGMAEDMEGYPWSPLVWLRATTLCVRNVPSDTVELLQEALHPGFRFPVPLRMWSILAGSGALLLFGWRFVRTTLLSSKPFDLWPPGVWLPMGVWVALSLVMFKLIIGPYLRQELDDRA